MAPKITVSWAGLVVLFGGLIAFQQFALDGPIRPALPGSAPAGTFGVVSVLVLIAALEAIWAAAESGRVFLYFSLGLIPSLIVLYAGVQGVFDSATNVGIYALQGLALLFVMFVMAGLSRKFNLLPSISMDAKLHKAVFWAVHGLGVVVALNNLLG